jgi:alkaline phosphatase
MIFLLQIKPLKFMSTKILNIKQIALITFLVIIHNQVLANPNSPVDSSLLKRTKKAKNIILMIGDGMGTAQIYSGITANKGLNIEQFKYIGFSKTYSSDNYVTDSGAGATAISTGVKTKNHYIAVDSSGNKLKTILEIAEDKGMYTGMVVTCHITHATPAAFISHNINRDNYEEIAADFLKTDIEVFIGGGKDNFTNRKDNRDLIQELKKKGYQVTDTFTDLPKIKSGKLAGFTAKKSNPYLLDGRGDMLCIGTETALNILNQSPKGFFLMIEGSLIDWASHDNDQSKVVAEVVDFDKAVGKVLEFARKDKNTLVIVTADHETGGMAINSGNINTGTFEAAFNVKDHTGVMVPVFAYGPGAENFGGIYENTEIFYKMLESLK